MQSSVLHLLEQEVDCYRRLARLAEQQHLHVQQNQTDALLDLLKQRQEMLDQIAFLQQTAGPARKRWDEYLGSMNRTDRTRAEALLAETRQLLEQIMIADRNDVMVLQQRKLHLGQQIRQATTARSVNRAYGAAVSSAASASSTMNMQK